MKISEKRLRLVIREALINEMLGTYKRPKEKKKKFGSTDHLKYGMDGTMGGYYDDPYLDFDEADEEKDEKIIDEDDQEESDY